MLMLHPLNLLSDMVRSVLSTTLLALLLTAGCASSKKMAKEPHVLAGAWLYSLDTPEGVYTGEIMFMEVASVLQGTITSNDTPDQSVPLEDVVYDAEMATVTFKFDGGQYGTMRVKTKLEGDNMMGTMNVGAYGVDVSLEASRKAE